MNRNMRNTKTYRRGVRLDIYYKRIRDLLTKWDRCCVTAAKARQIPSWLGHIPIFAAAIIVTGVFVVTLFSLVSSFLLLIGGGIWWILSTQKDCYRISENEDNKYGPQYRDGPDGVGWYDSNDYLTGVRMDSNNDDE